MFTKIAWATLTIALSVSAANSVTLQDLQGRVFIDRGDGFVPVSSPTTVSAGARVMTSANASAQLVFGPNCVRKIPSGQVIIVPSDKACGGWLDSKSGQALLVAGALGVGGVTAILVSQSSGSSPVSP